MNKFEQHVKYAIRPSGDGGYKILQKYRDKKVDIHSHHDTLEEAQDALDDLYTAPSHTETLKLIGDMLNSIKHK
jgi:hypothetical protein